MALTNLVTNGLKFNRSERPTVEIGFVDHPEPSLYVRDNGIGLSPRHHQAIFDLFRRLHPRQQYTGSGVGLSLVRRVAEAHGGRVHVESQPGRGATFRLVLPTLIPPGRTPPVAAPHFVDTPTTVASA
jgi:signal transduction histidine kinase